MGSRIATPAQRSNTAAEIRFRSSALALLEPVSTRTEAGFTPAAVWAATISTSRLVFPVPLPPTTTNRPVRSGSSRPAAAPSQYLLEEGGAGMCRSQHEGPTSRSDLGTRHEAVSE
ncbi:Uncharacterised protein [Mycobacteroides abscessus subsp. massiliense]|nr:Uncharacterised protein [Mycobacteroides abscessus subsp. massiliense]